VPKLHLPNCRKFYARRQFASGHGLVGLEISVACRVAPFGTELLFAAADVPGLTLVPSRRCTAVDVERRIGIADGSGVG